VGARVALHLPAPPSLMPQLPRCLWMHAQFGEGRGACFVPASGCSPVHFCAAAWATSLSLSVMQSCCWMAWFLARLEPAKAAEGSSSFLPATWISLRHSRPPEEHPLHKVQCTRSINFHFPVSCSHAACPLSCCRLARKPCYPGLSGLTQDLVFARVVLYMK